MARDYNSLLSSRTRDPSPHRRGSSQDEGMSSSISSQFAAAAAANSAHGQVRYAAHIPLNRNDSTTSGRVSTTSMDSQQSGALDVASKNIDHVIDQARHRHHQHRNKFKEAIDYLDQIFEDLKKECDVEEKNNNTSPIKSPKTRTVPTVKQSETAAPIVQTATTTAAPKKKIVVKPVAVRAKPKELVKQNSSPVEVVIPVRKISAEASEEPNIAETIVLKKTDKMDFTRRWLQDDLGSLAHLPPANIAPHISYYQDFDEHSLGSCSAEVAAYNTTKDRKAAARKTSDNPRPFRPQPVYGLSSDPPAPSKSNNTLPRVTSTDEMRRSGSQDPYSSLTLRSMRSEGGDRENVSPSAFQSFNRGGGSMRSSLRSLPDHSPVRQRLPTKPDPLLSIDQLVAELELNTDHQPFSQIEKRRSFPTSFVAKPVMNEYERPRYRVMEPKTSQSSQIQKAAYRPKPQYSLEETSRHPHQNLYKQNTLGNNAFETINQEKINPSRVEAMHNMFEKGTAPTAWKKMSPPQEAQYATLHSYSPPTINNNSNYPSQMHPISNSSNNNSNVRYAEYTPQVPTSQPPQRPPGSANSSQGGYYSSNSSGVGSNYPHVTNPNTARRSLVIDQQSISSRVPSVDEDDDGFYDNIGIYDDRRFSRGSELEASSSFRLPPSSSSSTNPSGTKHRIGSFLRKIGHAATSNRPPGSAASLLSLNKLSGNETVMKPVGGLMKSNSLSTEPWKKQVMREQTPKGLGARLKNTIFGGSRKRLDS
ncbi:unnamed protein product [Caenorhabditis angaria]|uniref:Uncharacterized protein n=1 Tax=Caenorhabditis angaria TaxID=860376 RepID=A0A9P1MX43_9PELO|nr:unnamed protein product [Caenorhabditis angaria]